MKCCICGKEIVPDAVGWDGGHNAMPIKDGRCCSDCNIDIVIPERLKNIQRLDV